MLKVNSNSKVTEISKHDANVLRLRESLIKIGVYDRVKNQDFGEDGFIILKGIPKIKGIVKLFEEALDYDIISGFGGKITIYKKY